MLMQLTRVLWAGFLCALLHASVSGSQASASCGDWLAHDDPTLATASSDQAPASSDRAPSPPPCNGPGCRQAPSTPAPPAPAPDQLVRSKPIGPSQALDQHENGPSPRFARLASRVHALKGFFPLPDPPPRVS